MIKISGFKKADAGQVIAYNAIKNEKTKFGTFKKTYFHIHTPESYDYYFLNDWKKSGLKKHTETEVFNYCLDNKIITPNAVLEEIELDEKYKSKKEMLAFLALAQSLIEKSAEIVVVSDHNTIAGFEKLYHAFELLKGYKANITPPKLVLGIEISCADLLHVVGIFERNDSVISLLNQWLKENLINVESGSYKTSLDVLQFIQSLEGIGYIAHISSENIFKENSLNKAYKEKLFNDNCLKAVGVKNKEQVKTVKNMLTQYRSTDISFVIDTDSHCVDDIEEQYFWIKGSKAGFTAIKEAIIDYDISIAFENNVTTEQYIEGIYITYNDKGFLSGKGDKKPFCLSFSNSLNCLIGGRGTGKSTVLEMLEYILSQRYDSYHLLEFICNHGYSYVLYMYEGTEYFIEMRMPYKKDEHDKVSKIILQSRTRRYYSERFQGKELEIKKCLINYYLKIYRIKQTDETLQVEIVSNKADFLKKFFDTRHSINDLVNSTSEANINEFIYNTLFKNKTLSDPRKGINFKKFSGLKKAILKIEEIFNDREKEVKSVIEPFNETQKGTLKIGYNLILGMTSPPYEKLLFGSNFKERVYYKSFNITEQNIVEYLDALFMELGMFEFFKMIVDKDVTKALKTVDIIDFCSTMTERLIDDGIKEINRENAHKILDSVFYDFLNEDNVNLIKEYFQDAVFDAESFSLKFNINNKENATGKPIFKNVDELSLGQKVVAMLSFILGYSEYSKDYRPLLLDQPEDNLDNQYIYKNLVAELRKVKDKRQVIIATHNATIVTNAKADQVCVMESDNEHGWISITGYPGERKIKEKIINYLEGGKESFKHKISIYDEVLK